MEFTSATTILLTGASIALGAKFGALRSKIFSSKSKSQLHLYFYAFAVILFLVSLLFGFIYRMDFVRPNWFGIIVLLTATASSIALFFLTKKYLVVKDTYTTAELNPIVNNWTSNADKHEIKLFGGDLNFFGETPNQMETNLQYAHLRKMGFDKVSILCEVPNSAVTKIRYGKILVELRSELRFYNPKHADLNVRGRIIQVQSVDKLLVYIKVKSGEFQAVETDRGNSNGALYNNIWDLVWSLATKPTPDQIESYKKLFQERE